MQKLTLSVQQACAICKAAGFRIGYLQMTDGIVSGAYPFGRVVRTGSTGRNTYEIFRVDLVNWLRQKGADIQ